jgi:hypothetical protein
VSRGYIAVDLDATLAFYEHGKPYSPADIGPPVPAMLERVQRWLAEGRDVRIMTARVYSDGTPERDTEVRLARHAIAAWCNKHVGCVLQITCQKSMDMLELYDDRAVQVEANTGRLIGQSTRGV